MSGRWGPRGLERELAERRATREWAAGACHFCGVLDAAVDGDRLRWADARRTVCSGPSCVAALRAAVDRELASTARSRRRKNPAEVHAEMLEEKREAQRRYRAAAKARRERRTA